MNGFMYYTGSVTMLKSVTDAVASNELPNYVTDCEDIFLRGFEKISSDFYATKQKIVVFMCQKKEL